MKKTAVVIIFSTLVFASTFLCFKQSFQSPTLKQFIWDVNTFHGMFADLPGDLPKEDIIGSYAYMFKDYYTHLPKTVAENATYYASLLAVFISLFISQCLLKKLNLNHFCNLSIYLLIVVVGLFARFFFAYHTTGNHDMASWYINKSVLEAGENMFAVTDRYNYSPFWFLVLKFLIFVNDLFPKFPFMFIVRSFLILIDSMTAVFIILIAKEIRVSSLTALTLFFLNPITIIITGYHGQFDNIPILFILFSIYAFLKLGKKSALLGWTLMTIGMIAKHEILQQILIFLRQARMKKKTIFILFSLSVALFLISFVPYWAEGNERIVRNVLSYSGMVRPYGLIYFHVNLTLAIIHKFLFISLLLAWPFIYRVESLIKSSLMGMLFFLAFTSGISAQQLILPIALGALQPDIGFLLFTTAASFFLLGNIDELKIHFFNIVTWNYVWVCALIWFLIELRKSNFRAK